MEKFYAELKNFYKGKPLQEETLNSLREMSTEKINGGLIIPQDIKEKIKTLRRSGVNLEQYITVEPVTTLSGSRIVELNSYEVPFELIEEGREFATTITPEAKEVKYLIQKYGGEFKITQDLMSDALTLNTRLVKFAGQRSRVTRNGKVLSVLAGLSSEVVAIGTVKDLKAVFNKMLHPAIEVESVVVMNQDAFDKLDNMVDEAGNSLFKDGKLFGRYVVLKMSNVELPSVAGKAPIYCGSLKEAITLYDREAMTVAYGSTMEDWVSDIVSVKFRERFDVQLVDEAAVVKCELTL